MKSTKKRRKILVVDDAPVNVQLLVTYLEAEGYDVISAANGGEAVKQVRCEKPDLVLLDVMMPLLDGFEVCKILKSDNVTKFTPVIMVTALNEIKDKVKGMDSGADDYLSKPFNKMELLARVRSLLRIKDLNDQLNEKVDELEEAKELLRQQAITDGLTGLFNYRHFKEQLLMELNRAQRHNTHVSLIMLDIDYFKHYNDTNGHPAGDMVLKELAELLKVNVRKIDLAARYGGEEFVLVLMETNKESARFVAEKIRRLVEEHPFAFEEKQPNGKLTISTGVATFPEDEKDFDGLVKVADERLYLAKQAGRNLIFFES